MRHQSGSDPKWPSLTAKHIHKPAGPEVLSRRRVALPIIDIDRPAEIPTLAPRVEDDAAVGRETDRARDEAEALESRVGNLSALRLENRGGSDCAAALGAAKGLHDHIALLGRDGHDGHGNGGDELILSALLEQSSLRKMLQLRIGGEPEKRLTLRRCIFKFSVVKRSRRVVIDD